MRCLQRGPQKRAAAPRLQPAQLRAAAGSMAHRTIQRQRSGGKTRVAHCLLWECQKLAAASIAACTGHPLLHPRLHAAGRARKAQRVVQQLQVVCGRIGGVAHRPLVRGNVSHEHVDTASSDGALQPPQLEKQRGCLGNAAGIAHVLQQGCSKLPGRG